MTESLQKRPEVVELPRRHVPQVAVIDLDRTLVDIDASMQRLFNAMTHCGADSEPIKAVQRTKESDGGSFEPLSLVQEQLDEEGYRRFKEHFITAEGPSIMYPHAQPFLNRLTAAGLPFVVRTWGNSDEWQHLKVAAAGYEGPYEVMNTKDKGAEINSWKIPSPDGSSTIVIPTSINDKETIVADTAVLIDDKAISFQSLEEIDAGFWITPENGEFLESQKGNVPDNVEIATLDDLVVIDGEITKKADVLPEGMRFTDELTEKHIEQLVAYSTDPEDEGIQNNTSDGTRFKDRDAVFKWKELGRSTTIITNDEGDLLGLSWLGAKDIDLDGREGKRAFNPSQYGATFAIRVYGDARGQGLSSKLTKRAEKQFKKTAEYRSLVEQGKAQPWLEVSAENTAAVRSYTRAGYVEATEPNEDGKILMIKKAKSSPTTIFTKN